jgi:hypothetical protein
MINTFINEFNNLPNLTKINNASMRVHSANQENITYQNGSTTVTITINAGDRISIQDQATNANDKYIEEIRWSKGNNMAIAIGLNLSQCLPNSLDKTNQLVCYSLKNNGYDRYYLMNLYFHVQTNKFKRKGNTSQSDVICNTIIKYLINNPSASIDIVFFFGRSCYLTKKMMTNLSSVSSLNVKYYVIGIGGVIANRHQHPGRGVSTTNIGITSLGKTIHFSGNYIK